MKIVKVGVSLTLHSLSLHLKFPACAFLQLEVNKMRRQIVANCELGPKPIKLSKEVREQVEMVYHSEAGEYEQKRMNIVILIKTKNNPNKLTAGIVEIDLKTPDSQLNFLKAKPSRCNDETAFLQYSLKTHIITPQEQSAQNSAEGGSRTSRNRASSSPKIINSAVQYKTTQMQNSQQRQKELMRLLSDSHIGDSYGSKRKHFSAHKNIHKQNSEVDESKTQRRSYGINRSNEVYLPRKQESVSVINQLNKKYATAQKAASEAQQNVATLSTQNKELRQKIKELEGDLEQQEAIVRSMNKKLELKESASGDEVNQLKNKLQQSEIQIHALINQKNNLLNSLQNKEKQWLILLKEKERTLNEDKKEIALQLEQKEHLLKETAKENNRLKQNSTVSQAMVQLLTDTNNKLEQKLQASKSEASRHKIELQKVNEDIVELQKLFNSQMQTTGEIKNQKKQIQELQRFKDEAELIIKQKQAEILKITAEGDNIKTQLKTANSSLATTTKKLQEQSALNELLKQTEAELKQKQKELTARVNRYQAQLKNQQLNTGKFDKHVKEVQFQLSKIKMEVENTTTTKAKKISDYERVNELLNKKLELLAQQNLQLAVKYMQLVDKSKVKEDELFQLGQQLLKLKQHGMNLEVQVQTLRQDNNFLVSQTKILDLREEEIGKLREQIDYKDKIMEELEHQHQLRQIQLNNEVKLLLHKVEQREEQVKELNEYVGSLQQKELELHQEIQNLNYSIKNKENQIQYIKHDFQSQRKNNFEFQQRMHILTATQNASITSVQQLRLENLGFKNMLRENQQAINVLGKRYDNLFKGTVESLQRLLEILKNSKNIINQSIRHQKVQIATLLNDLIRFIGEQRRQQKEQLTNLQKELSEENDKNRQNLKLIKIKSQIQEELQREMQVLKKEQELFQGKLNCKESQILQYQEQIKDKISNIRELNLLVENIKKQGRAELNRKDQTIKQKNLEIDTLKEHIITETQRWKAESLLLVKKAETAQIEFNTKLTNQQTKIGEIELNLKTQKQSVKLLRLKNADLQNTINKLSKQKEEIGSQLQKKAKELIAAKVQSEFKSKLIAQKQAQISQNKKAIDKLCKQKQSLQNKRNWLQEGNKTLVITRNELQQSLRVKCDELLEAQQKIRSLEQGQSKISKQKQDLVKQRKQQLETISKLNDSIKTLKDELLKKEKEMNGIILEKDSMQKQFNKKLNIVNRQKEGMQKHLKEFKASQTEFQNEITSKCNLLATQLQLSERKNDQHVQIIQKLKAEGQVYQNKVSKLTIQMNQRLNYKLDSNELGQQKRKQILALIIELKQLKTPQKTKTALSNLKSSMQGERSKQLSKYWRELTLVLNQLKIKINRMSIQNQHRVILLQDIKILQIAYENICKCSVF